MLLDVLQKPANASTNVTVSVNLTATEWLGFYKTGDTKPMVSLLAGYICAYYRDLVCKGVHTLS